MSMPLETAHAPASAIVARPTAQGSEPDSYLQIDERGRAHWTADPALATAFSSMREAARAAFRLPASVRAYGLPRSVELAHGKAH